MTGLLLDTHVLLWWLLDDAKLSERGRTLIGQRQNTIFVSAATRWEIGIKAAKNKLTIPDNFDQRIQGQSYRLLAIDWLHTMEVSQLPPIHGDPFDRMLVAQARVDKLSVVTCDEKINKYDVSVVMV